MTDRQLLKTIAMNKGILLLLLMLLQLQLHYARSS